jgi:hypothetical protein
MILQPAGRREACQGQSQGQPSIAVRRIMVSQDQELADEDWPGDFAGDRGRCGQEDALNLMAVMKPPTVRLKLAPVLVAGDLEKLLEACTGPRLQ